MTCFGSFSECHLELPKLHLAMTGNIVKLNNVAIDNEFVKKMAF